TTSRRVPPLRESENIVVDVPLSRESISYSWLTPAWFEEGDAALDLAATWIYRRLAERLDPESYRSISVGQTSYGHSGRFTISVRAEEDVDAPSFLEEMDGAVRALQDAALPQPDFEALLESHRMTLQVTRDRPLSRASHLAGTGSTGRFWSVEENLERFGHLTADELRRVVQRWLPLDRRVRVHQNFFRFANRDGNVR
ncbi:MAG: hypothetical protein AAGE52_16770, partial [Myxococcota bacterium]